jgi:ABC-type transporter Mla subunit MlaD
MPKVAEASTQLGTALGGSLITNANTAATALKGVADQVDRCLTGMRQLVSESATVAAALDAVEKAAAKAAGDGSSEAETV